MTEKQYPSQTADRFMVRLPDGMRDQISAAAKASNRTMNAEVVSRLEFTFAVDVTVQDTGWDVGHGIDSPEMKAALLRQRHGDKAVAAPSELAEIRKELQELRSEINKLKETS